VPTSLKGGSRLLEELCPTGFERVYRLGISGLVTKGLAYSDKCSANLLVLRNDRIVARNTEQQPLTEQVNSARPLANVCWLGVASRDCFVCQPQVRLPCAEKEGAFVKDRPKVFPSPLQLIALKPLPIRPTVCPRCKERADDARDRDARDTDDRRARHR
jgi:hypothetical protein